MNKRLVIILALVVGAVAGALYFWFFSWDPAQLQTVVSCDGERFEVRARRQRCIHVAVGHFPIGFIRSGRIEVSLRSGMGRAFEFEAGEDMELFAVHQVGGDLYLVFFTRYSGRRFAIYKYDIARGEFAEVSPMTLPHNAAYPNFGEELSDARKLLSSQTNVSFAIEASRIGWLWDLIIVGKVHANDARALEYFMSNHREEFLEKMSRR